MNGIWFFLTPFFYVEIFHLWCKPHCTPLSTTSQITGFGHSPRVLQEEPTSTTVPHVLREKRMLTWVPLDTPRQEVLVRKSSRPPTRSLGMLTSMVFDLQNTGTAGTGTAVRTRKVGLGEGKEDSRRNNFSLPHLELFVLSSRKPLRLKTHWWIKPGLLTPRVVVK